MTMRQDKSHKRSGGGDERSGSGWELVYSGFAMILLCFFIMMSSFSTMQEAKVVRFVRSFVDALSILSGGVKPEEGGIVLNPSAPMVSTDHSLSSLMNDLKNLAHKEGIEDEVFLAMVPEGLAMRLSDRALFDLGAADLSDGARRLLRQLSEIIGQTGYHVRIEGHTDDLPIRTASYPSNWELSTARAVNVLRYLQSRQQIPPERLSAVGFGEYKPLFPNDSPTHRARNRRVEIVFIDRSTQTDKGH